LPTWKAIVGDQIFTHESGIHADGVLKNPLNYEAFPPEAVGLTRQLIIGKHSGSAALVHKFHEFNIDLSRQQASEILETARSMSVELKRPLFDKELVYIYQGYRQRNGYALSSIG
jgi:homocitrate synthase NifV